MAIEALAFAACINELQALGYPQARIISRAVAQEDKPVYLKL